ncbi:MAG TPA: Rpn family recombination-promoting nuclease/putative transposase [Candidatus Kapabacteria bacterium]|nr:Rpn family recombination-promoting nuclease/putative transposase [Candidatus Kapabacteria bacterium]
MSSERKLVSFDWVMKQLLRNKADFVIFEGFLSELLHDDIKIKSLLESESNGDSKNDKTNRVDILVENSREELIIIEVQRETEYDYLQRILFGTSKLLLEYMQKGMPYSKIRKVISISLVYFDLGQGEDYAYYGKTEFIGLNKKDILELNSAQQELYKTEKIANIYPEYYILKINRFDDIARNTIDEWIYFFKNEKIKDNFTARGLKEAKEKLDILKLSDEERREYEEYLENLHYQASMYESSYKIGEMKGKKEGKEEGIEEGIEVGSKNKALEMAKKLKEKGIDIAVISETSGLAAEEIARL